MSYGEKIYSFTQKVPVYESKATEDGYGTTLLKIGDEWVHVDVLVDRPMLFQMAYRAAKNKTRQCTDGPIKVVIRGQAKEPRLKEDLRGTT